MTDALHAVAPIAAALLTLAIATALLRRRSKTASATQVALSPELTRHVKAVLLPEAKVLDGRMFPLTLLPKDENAGAAERIALGIGGLVPERRLQLLVVIIRLLLLAFG